MAKDKNEEDMTMCPFGNMPHATCNVGDTPTGMSDQHVAWHMQRMIANGTFRPVEGKGADDLMNVPLELTDE